jgi:hypothetical protein
MTALSTPHGSAHSGVPALMARYHSLVDARYAIRALESKGVDGDDIALVGAAVDAERTTERSAIDRRILSSVSLSLVVGIVAGGLVGAVLGAAAMGLVVLLGPDLDGWVFGLMVGWCAAMGALFGSLASVMRTLGFSESLPLTWEDGDGHPVWLAVYGEAGEVRPDVEATRPEQILDDPVETAHPDEVAARAS